jgi:hypothetical protein
MSNKIVIHDSASIIDSYFNDITDLINNEKFILFIDWKNFMVEYKQDENIILRNNNGYAFESYNNLIKHDRLKGFFIISEYNINPDDIQIAMDNFNISTDLIKEKNDLILDEDKNEIINGIMYISYSYIITPSHKDIKYHELTNKFLQINYININPFIKKQLLIFCLTSDLLNIIDILVFSNYNNNSYIFYFPTRKDEKMLIERFGLSNYRNMILYNNFFDLLIDKINKSWNLKNK